MNNTKILIVEDELLLAKNLARKLEKLGYVIIGVVSSGVAAIEKATELKPDLILMDIVIKGDLDGIDTATIVHDQLNIPVIYTTAYADDDTLRRAEKTGSYGYIIKPFKERDLNAAIKIALNKHQETVEIHQSLAASEAISEEKSRYISMASHDLRNPLMTIQMSAGMLQQYEGKLDKTKKEKHFIKIQDAVNNMNQLLEDILMLSKAESGKIPFNPAPLEVIGFCRKVIEEVQPFITDQHHLNLSSKSRTYLAALDEKLLHHLLMNLLTNAVKYSPKGGEIKLEVISHKKEIIFRIKDQGIGIPPEYQAKLFQQFVRASNVGNIKGTGLGLCIVKQAVDLHGGEITVESQLGVGTTFIVTLPLTSEINSSSNTPQIFIG
ncbi:MAG: ATP-binding protein [Actinomycetota bacterium]